MTIMHCTGIKYFFLTNTIIFKESAGFIWHLRILIKLQGIHVPKELWKLWDSSKLCTPGVAVWDIQCVPVSGGVCEWDGSELDDEINKIITTKCLLSCNF